MPVTEGVHRGTLVCVVLKAKNLPNKRSIGKQDPYCVLQLGAEQQKTKPDKRGGQHPTWDEQLHFEIHDDMEDTAKSPVKSSAKSTPKVLKVACWADDVRDPEFIGEGIVELDETLKTGEYDDWVTIKAKDRYAGEVYLELTFYSSAAPPKHKKKPAMPSMSGTDTYGGAGTFVHDFDDRRTGRQSYPGIPSHMRSDSAPGSSQMASSSSHVGFAAPQFSGAPSALQPSTSLAALNVDEYNPVYAPAILGRPVSPVPPNRAASRGQYRQEGAYNGAGSDSHGPRSASEVPIRNSETPLPPPPRPSSTYRPSSAMASFEDAASGLQQSMSAMSFANHPHEKPLPAYEHANNLPMPPAPNGYAYGNSEPSSGYTMPPSANTQHSIALGPPRSPVPYGQNDQRVRPVSGTYHALPPTPASRPTSRADTTAPKPVVNAQALYQSIAGPPASAPVPQPPLPSPGPSISPYQPPPPASSVSPAPRPLPPLSPAPHAGAYAPPSASYAPPVPYQQPPTFAPAPPGQALPPPPGPPPGPAYAPSAYPGYYAAPPAGAPGGTWVYTTAAAPAQQGPVAYYQYAPSPVPGQHPVSTFPPPAHHVMHPQQSVAPVYGHYPPPPPHAGYPPPMYHHGAPPQ